MGIEKFMNQFDETFNITYYLDDNNKINDGVLLFFDFNSLIHNSIPELLKYIKINNIIKKKEIDKMMINIVADNFIKHINKTINIKEICYVYIFLDGVPSLNKMNEQKHRKFYTKLFESMKNKFYNISESNEDNITWNRNKISPGTEFMINLTEYFNSLEYKNILKKNNIVIKYFSDTLEHDEAEIKIVNYINKYYDKNKSYIIYSPDADIILLAMSFNKENINTIKVENEQDENEYKYRFVNIDKLILILYNNIKIYKYFIININNKDVIDKLLIKKIGKNYVNQIILKILNLMLNDKNYIESLQIPLIKNLKKKFLKNKFDIINDLILLFVFFGNDFLPKISTISLNETEIHLFLFYYCSGVIKYLSNNDNNYDNYYLSKNINSNILLYLIKELSNIELNNINNSIPDLSTKKKYSGIRTVNNPFEVNDYLVKFINPLKVDNYEVNKKFVKINYQYYNNINDNLKYKIDQYKKLIDLLSLKFNYLNYEKTCQNYLHGLYWIKDSYFYGKINKWIYGNIFSPLLIHLYYVLNDNKQSFDNFKYDNNILDYKLITPKIQFILTCPFNFKNKNININIVESFTYDNNEINDIIIKANKVNELFKNFYIDILDFTDKLFFYKKEYKLTNNNMVNYYNTYKKNNINNGDLMIDYINKYDKFNIYEIICIDCKYLNKCKITTNLFNIFNESNINFLI